MANFFIKPNDKKGKYYQLDHLKLLEEFFREFKKGVITRKDLKSLWICRKGIWQELDELSFSNYIHDKARGSEFGDITNDIWSRNTNEAYKVITALTLDCFDYGPGGIFDWAHNRFGHILPFKENFINSRTFEKIKPDPKFYKITSIPIEIQDEDNLEVYNCPQWMQALNLIYDNNQEIISLVQEMFGYCFLGDSRFHKLFILLGDGGTGKGTVLKVLRMILSGDSYSGVNTSAVSIDGLSKDFSLAMLHGKFANISDETPRFLRDSTQIVKAISSGDPQMINKKFEIPFMAPITTKLIFSSNEKPNFGEVNEAIERRVLIIPHKRKIYGTTDEDNQLVEDVLCKEIKDILFWALAGLKRLLENNKFTIPQASRFEFEDMLRENDNIKEFVDDNIRITLDKNDRITTESLFLKFKQWKDNQEIKQDFSKIYFMRRVKKYLKGCEMIVSKNKDGNSFKEILGITFGHGFNVVVNNTESSVSNMSTSFDFGGDD